MVYAMHIYFKSIYADSSIIKVQGLDDKAAMSRSGACEEWGNRNHVNIAFGERIKCLVRFDFFQVGSRQQYMQQQSVQQTKDWLAKNKW